VLLSDFDFDLPDALIAQHPLPERAASRLLLCQRAGLQDRLFVELPELLLPGDLLVFNDTRVIKARLAGFKESGGKIEALIERVLDTHRALAQVRASHAPLPGSRLVFAEGVGATVLARHEGFFELAFDAAVYDVLEQHGSLPLPPYITHAADAVDQERYQTVFARHPGAVAAPTAGLHFDAPLLAALAARGVHTTTLTLHVGAGTFQPVRVEQLSEHRMHLEHYIIPPTLIDAIARTRARGGRVVAVGTTALRALESAAAAGTLSAGPAETRLFITPGYRFRVVDRLITNFHLPKSTLLMLVSAFAGVERIRAAYAHAIHQRYRFFSYGDAMLLEPDPAAPQES
jgi:S-adenosylmethionine:tRNA ribosyltransferase-isomerase